MSLPDESFQCGNLQVLVYAHGADAQAAAAATVAAVLERTGGAGRRAVLGLATGRSPVGIYAELVRRHREGLSFAHAETFNLDEYWPIAAAAEGSFHRFMARHLFDHVDLPPDRRHLPSGEVDEARIPAHCGAYEALIRGAGGIDLQLLGLGANGHVGFNEPGSDRATRTRRVPLAEPTRAANAGAFGALQQVPRFALTMGVATILEARALLLCAFGPHKAEILARALTGPATADLPASFLREHPACTVVADAAAARLLPRG